MAESTTNEKARKCPSCGKPQSERFRPFCSKRCSDLDLGRWLKGSYGIPAQEDDDSETPSDPEGSNVKQ